MRIESTDERQRLWENLLEVTDQSAKSKGFDDAARYYCRMRGDVAAYGSGRIKEFLRAADDRGSLTASEIAEILDTRELLSRSKPTFESETESTSLGVAHEVTIELSLFGVACERMESAGRAGLGPVVQAVSRGGWRAGLRR